jgi:hypothetical protein
MNDGSNPYPCSRARSGKPHSEAAVEARSAVPYAFQAAVDVIGHVAGTGSVHGRALTSLPNLATFRRKNQTLICGKFGS